MALSGQSTFHGFQYKTLTESPCYILQKGKLRPDG
jgi:hypothetical protein